MSQKKPYFRVNATLGDNPIFCYRTGLTVYEETLFHGVLVSSGYNAAGYPLDVLTNCPTRLNPGELSEASSFLLEANGQALWHHLSFVSFTQEEKENGVEARLTLDSTLLPIRLTVCTFLDGSPMFTRYIEIENLSDEPIAISRMGVLCGGLEAMDRSMLTLRTDCESFYSLGTFDSDVWGREGELVFAPLKTNVTSIDTRFRRDRFRQPALFIRNELTGRLFFAQIAWSGGCRFSVDYNTRPEAKGTMLSLSCEITGYTPLLVLRGKEAFATPEVHLGVVQGDLDEAVNATVSHLRTSVLSDRLIDPSPCLVGAGMGAEHPMSVEGSIAFIDQFAKMGGEVFIVDAGWECPPNKEKEWGAYNGYNLPHPDRYPDGITVLADYCHKKGLSFGLWVEIERLGRLCPMQSRPHFRADDIYGHKFPEFLDMTDPEAAAWAENELARIITEYKLDLLRVDYNVSPLNFFGMRDTGSGIPECLSLRHFDAVYQMYRRLKARFPQVTFENCSSGGARCDLGILKAFHHTWVSDWQRLPRAAMITNGMTMLLPPERVDRLFAGMGGHVYGSLDAQMRNTMLGHMTLNVIAPATSDLNPEQLDFVRHSVELYKTFIRPILPTCKVYHHTPDVAASLDKGLSILEIAAPDKSRGAMTVLTLTGAKAEALSVIPRGVDASKRYRVTLDNRGESYVTDGHTLLSVGIPISLPASLSSELVLYCEEA